MEAGFQFELYFPQLSQQIAETTQLLLNSAPFLLKGAYFTVILSLGGMFFGLALGSPWR